jgi:hypothetical protein
MTMDRIGLKELVEKGSNADLLREMIAFVTARMMDMEVESLTGAALGPVWTIKFFKIGGPILIVVAILLAAGKYSGVQ